MRDYSDDPDNWHALELYEAAWSQIMDLSPAKPTEEQDRADRERRRDEANPDPRSPRRRVIAMLDAEPGAEAAPVTQTQDEMLAALGYGSTEQLVAMMRAQGMLVDEPEE